MAASDNRPKRVLAAWGYESDRSGDRVEVDVWTVNEAYDPDAEAIRRARAAFSGRVERVIAAYGNVARVSYAGAAGEGYRYIDENEAIEENGQNAFAGAKRSAGGDRGDDGQIQDGYDAPPGEPAIEEAIREGERNVIPVARAASRGPLIDRIGRQPSRDEEGEPVETPPFDGFRNVIRYFTNDTVERYHVRNGQLRAGTGPGGRP
jgi:hypothetical protein